MLKLCLALPTFYPTFGGGSLRFLRYQPGLRERGIQARVLAGTARAKDLTQQEIDLGWREARIGERLPLGRVEGIPVHRVRLPDTTGLRRTATYFRALIELCEDPETRPDVIQIHSFERLESLYWLRRIRRLGIPILYAIQIARPAVEETRLRQLLKERMLRGFYDLFDGVVTSSERIRDYLHGVGVRSPIAVIPNGVDLERYSPASPEERLRAREKLGIEGTGPVLLSVGAVSPRKGTDLLVEAFDALGGAHSDAHLVVVGPRHDQRAEDRGPFERRLEQLLARSAHAERIHFTGVRDDLPDFYAAADLVVLPTNREGGTPNVVLEAMACGRPVLITPFEGQSAAIGRPGLELEQVPRTAAALAEGLTRLLGDRDRREALASHGLDWVRRRLDQRHSLDCFAELYRRAAEGSLSSELFEREPFAGSPATPAPLRAWPS